ncbi:putative amidoligase enzyme-domain-containing protein [Hypoxylon sp. NC1633]|nr:putative amidoligase enzyme-domain-containing protein [Hypoxylon sp. NC1633]
MAGPDRFTVPVGVRHSVGIELECLVAYLPPDSPDPHPDAGLPPVLRHEKEAFLTMENVLQSIRNILKKNGVPVNDGSRKDSREDLPIRLHYKENWDVATDISVNEVFREEYEWANVEIRSPAMWATEQAFEEIRYVVNVLTSNLRVIINPTCGFHVHVGNGRKFFQPQTIKRLGSFLWAADPMLSRIHPPWRRVFEYCPSIRHESRLACREEERPPVRYAPETDYDALPVVDFSDTSREESEYGGLEGWQKWAAWRKQVGPFMALDEHVDETVGHGIGNERGGEDDSNLLSPLRGVVHSSEPSGPPSSLLRELSDNSSGNGDDNGGDELRRSELFDEPPADLLVEADTRSDGLRRSELFDEPPADLLVEVDPHSDDHNASEPPPHELIDDDDFDDYIRFLSEEETIREARRLYDEYEQHDIPPPDHALHRNLGWMRWVEGQDPKVYEWLLEYCSTRFHTRDILTVNTAGQIELIMLAQCYIIFGHTNIASLSENERHAILEACGPYFEIVRSSWQWNAATERWNLVHHRTPELLHPRTRREINIDAEYVVSKFEKQAELLELEGEHKENGIEYLSRSEYYRGIRTNAGFTKMFNDLRDYAGSPAPDFRKQMADLAQSIFAPIPSSPLETHPGDDSDVYMPPAWRAAHPEPTPPEPEPPAKLLPHDPDALSATYKDAIEQHVTIREHAWPRMNWLPSDTYPMPDPQPNQPAVITTTAAGMAQIAACESAAQVGALLDAVGGGRCNYNFTHYNPPSLSAENGGAMTSWNPRTVEFREAAGTLDPAWIATWARVCVGIVRWARRAPVAEFLEVLDRVLLQEERDARARVAAAAGGSDAYEERDRDEAERYDVCDLLEDIGLFVEAAMIRKRESESGPPR